MPIKKSILLGCLARASIMSHYGRQNRGGSARAFAGKDSAGVPLSGHVHAFYIPTDEDNDGFLDHIHIVRKTGFTPSELNAIMSVSEMRSSKDGIAVHVKPCSSCTNSTIFAHSCRDWISLTPFLLNRHVKRRRERVVDSPEDQVRLELARRHSSYNTVRIHVSDCNVPMSVCRLRPNQYIRSRRPWDAPKPAYEIALTFRDPVDGPLLLGYGCHFGMGAFVPSRRTRRSTRVDGHNA